VTFHDAFPYFARHFGFELVGVILENVGQDPSAADLAALVDKVKAAHVRAVFSEAQFSPRLTETLADEAGISMVVTTLYNDALGDAPADTYVGLMRWNLPRSCPRSSEPEAPSHGGPADTLEGAKTGALADLRVIDGVRGLRSPPRLTDVSLSVRPGSCWR
jgi:hypothetical protein